MIRGPVLPKLRDGLWALVSKRLDQFEAGLSLVLESMECGDAALGPIDGLARDAMGGPVLVMLAVDGDTLLPARALAADNFLQRAGLALAQAVPEANFCHGVPGRLLIVGTEGTAHLVQQICELPIQRLLACTLEPFRAAGVDRFAVCWVDATVDGSASVASTASAPLKSGADEDDFMVPEARAAVWGQLRTLCEHMDPAVQLRGDRYSRQILWNGFSLGEVRAVDGAIIARSATGLVIGLYDHRDVRRFGDQLLRAFTQRAGLDLTRSKGESRAGRSAGDAGAGRLEARAVALAAEADEPEGVGESAGESLWSGQSPLRPSTE